jgi:hypothetical protein
MNIQDTLRKALNKVWRQQAHITRQADQTNLVFAQNGDDLTVVGFTFKPSRREDLRRDPARVGALNSLRAFAIGDHDSDVRVWNAACGNAIRKGFKIRAAPAQQHAYTFFHERKTLTQSCTPAKYA